MFGDEDSWDWCRGDFVCGGVDCDGFVVGIVICEMRCGGEVVLGVMEEEEWLR